MDVPNFIGSQYRPRSEFRPEEEQQEGMSPTELLNRVLDVICKFADAKEAVRLELHRIVHGDDPNRHPTG